MAADSPGADLRRRRIPADGRPRRLAFLLVLGALLLSAVASVPVVAAPLALPEEQYRTIRTEHFRVHYPAERKDVAVYVAQMAEAIHTRLEPKYRSGAHETHLVLIFRSDLINAYTTVYGMDRILLFMASPPADDFARYRDWIEQLLVHEYVHILTLRPYVGFWNTTLRLITGVPPNLLVATGLAEAYTVGEESYDGTGRLNDPKTLATRDILIGGNRFPSLEETMTGMRRWPYGETPYLFGGRFLAFARKACGDTAVNGFFLSKIPAIFPSWRFSAAGCGSMDSLYERYAAAERTESMQRQKERTREGVTPRQRLTFDGGQKRYLVLSEQGIFYFARPEGASPGIYSLDARNPTVPAQTSLFYRARDVAGFYLEGRVAVTAEPDIVLEGSVFRNVLRRDGRRIYDDTDRRETPAGGGPPARPVRSGEGGAPSAPAIAAGSGGAAPASYVYILRREPYTYLMEGPDETVLLRLPEPAWMGQPAVRIGADGRLERVAVVVRQAGRIDHSLVVCEKGTCREVLSGAATISAPSFASDGRLLFSSDVDGVFDVYAVDGSGAIRRLTRSLTGFMHPVLAEDGLFVIGTETNGNEVYRVANDAIRNEAVGPLFRPGVERDWLNPRSPLPYRPLSGDPNGPSEARIHETQPSEPLDAEPYRSEPYNGLLSFRPFMNGLLGGPLSTLSLGLAGYDPLSRHELNVGMGQYDSVRGYGFATYAYRRFRPDFVASFAGTPLDRAPSDYCGLAPAGAHRDFCQGERRFGFQESTAGMDLAVYHRLLRSHFSLLGKRTLYRNASAAFASTYQHENLDFGSLRAAMGVSYHESSARSISPERGFSVQGSVEQILPGVSHAYGEQGKILPLFYERYSGMLTLYLPFFVDYHVPVLQAYTSLIAGRDAAAEETQLSFVMPGFNAGVKGRAINVYWIEYRFPVWQTQTRLLPWFPSLGLRYLALAPFAATGQARNDYQVIDPSAWQNTAGLRLTAGVYVFYQPVEFQVTYARGSGPYGEGQVSFGFSIGAQPSPTGVPDALRRSRLLCPDVSCSNR